MNTINEANVHTFNFGKWEFRLPPVAGKDYNTSISGYTFNLLFEMDSVPLLDVVAKACVDSKTDVQNRLRIKKEDKQDTEARKIATLRQYQNDGLIVLPFGTTGGTLSASPEASVAQVTDVERLRALQAQIEVQLNRLG
jgi:hypothetical protein